MSTLYKATNLPDETIQPLILEATETVPTLTDLDAQRRLYDAQGKLIVDAMFASLPGGTMDAVLCQMLERKRSLFVVPHRAPKDVNP